MFIVYQIPFADARRFINEETNRLVAPAWPDPQPNIDFVRSFGGVRARRRGGVESWPGENIFCHSTKAIRFPTLPVPGGPRTRCALRRFWADGRALARIEVGFQINDPTNTSFTDETLIAAVTSILRLPVNVPNTDGTMLARKLLDAGRALANHYLVATTRKKNGKVLQIENWWLHPGSPLIIVEYDNSRLEKLPSYSRSVGTWEEEKVRLSHCRVEIDGRRLGVWLLGFSKGCADVDFLRRLRLHLARLHAEKEATKQILRWIAQERIAIEVGTVAPERLQEFLATAIALLTKQSSYGLRQSDILKATQDFENIVSDGEREILLTRLSTVRKSLLLKVENLTKQSDAFRGNILQIIGSNNQVISGQNAKNTMKTQSINFGDGNVFHGDVQLNQVAAEAIQNSFNRVSNSDIAKEMRDALSILSQQVAELCNQLPETEQKRAAQDLETLSNEALSASPRKKWYELSAEGLVEAAKTVRSLAEPIAESVKVILGLLG
jgi:hypothetical protein